jgi:hypothetical protein
MRAILVRYILDLAVFTIPWVFVVAWPASLVYDEVISAGYKRVITIIALCPPFFMVAMPPLASLGHIFHLFWMYSVFGDVTDYTKTYQTRKGHRIFGLVLPSISNFRLEVYLNQSPNSTCYEF